MRVWQSFSIDFVEVSEQDIRAFYQAFPTLIPREDVSIFLTAVHGRANIMVSENHAFVRQAAEAQNLFACLTMQKFMEQYAR